GHAGFVAVTARDLDDECIIGYAQVSAAHDAALVEVVLDPARPDPTGVRRADLLMAALDAADPVGDPMPPIAPTKVVWWVHQPSPADHGRARAAGLARERQLR